MTSTRVIGAATAPRAAPASSAHSTSLRRSQCAERLPIRGQYLPLRDLRLGHPQNEACEGGEHAERQQVGDLGVRAHETDNHRFADGCSGIFWTSTTPA